MRKSDLVVDTVLVTQSGYFRLATTLALGMGITDGNILFCHGISEGSVDNKSSTREYNTRKVYEFLNNPFPTDCGSPYLNLPPITIDYSPRPVKIPQYNPDLIPDTISVASENSVSNLTTPYDSVQVLVLNSDNPIHHAAVNKYNSFHIRLKIGYGSRQCNGIRR